MKITINDYEVQITARKKDPYFSYGEEEDTKYFLNWLAIAFRDAEFGTEEEYPACSRHYNKTNMEIIDQLNDIGFYDDVREEHEK